MKNQYLKETVDRDKNSGSRKVMVAMSGGVDSSVATYLLLKAGYEVTGATMYFDDFVKMHIEASVKVCSELKIEHRLYDFSTIMQKHVIEPFIKSYLAGRTPNPCIECNRYLKFGYLFDIAMKEGFDYFATGHYASIKQVGDNFFLCRAHDLKKDQSYFLYTIKRKNLSRILFPLADYTKEQVKNIAKKIGLPAAAGKESQEICFIENNDYKAFLKNRTGTYTENIIAEDKMPYDEKIKPAKQSGQVFEPGDIIDINGKVIGRHEGIANFTIGQRKGIKISSQAPLYVLDIDAAKNTVTVGQRESLNKKRLIASGINILVKTLPKLAKAKIRYNSKDIDCSINILDKKAEVIFSNGREAITPGQSVVFYKDSKVLGGAIIEKVFKD
ncbi:MAG: tRNA 2-thiouridine(34) synthase MnmA [Actinobacteria bacterium]|nr:tRNA 2-thiouridine(34) synthase MnmA [Actinomycetota bacterium]